MKTRHINVDNAEKNVVTAVKLRYFNAGSPSWTSKEFFELEKQLIEDLGQDNSHIISAALCHAEALKHR